MPSKASPKKRYGSKASQKVKRAMHEMKRGKLKSGSSGKTVKSKKQAITIGLRKHGAAAEKFRSRRTQNKPMRMKI
jgi:Family of unknown function (DUF6496)